MYRTVLGENGTSGPFPAIECGAVNLTAQQDLCMQQRAKVQHRFHQFKRSWTSLTRSVPQRLQSGQSQIFSILKQHAINRVQNHAFLYAQFTFLHSVPQEGTLPENTFGPFATFIYR